MLCRFIYGGGNLLQFVNCDNIIANDIDQYTIPFLQRLKEDITWLHKNNKEFTETDYKRVRDNKGDYDKAYIGYIGYALSFGGKFFGGYSKDKTGKRDYVAEAYRHLLKQAELLRDKNITFYNTSYENVPLPNNSIVYCDIPYKSTTKYTNSKTFDYDKFYDWCINKSIEGYKIYVSEYDMPEPFKLVWNKEIRNQMRKDNNSSKVVEKLYTI